MFVHMFGFIVFVLFHGFSCHVQAGLSARLQIIVVTHSWLVSCLHVHSHVFVVTYYHCGGAFMYCCVCIHALSVIVCALHIVQQLACAHCCRCCLGYARGLRLRGRQWWQACRWQPGQAVALVVFAVIFVMCRATSYLGRATSSST